MKLSRWIVLAGIALLVIVAMGAVAYNAYAQTPTQDGDDASESQENSAALQGQAGITSEEAVAIAVAEYPGAKVRATELESEGGVLLYSIELDNGAEVEVSANSGAILPAEAETGVDRGG